MAEIKAFPSAFSRSDNDAVVPDTLKHGGGGGTFDGMERIARLEAQMESVDKRLDKIDDKLDRIIEKTGALPTTNGLWGMVATVIGVGLAIAGLTFAIAEHVAK
jgi:hypothetical protein